jgi:hypothetical protein
MLDHFGVECDLVAVAVNERDNDPSNWNVIQRFNFQAKNLPVRLVQEVNKYIQAVCLREFELSGRHCRWNTSQFTLWHAEDCRNTVQIVVLTTNFERTNKGLGVMMTMFPLNFHWRRLPPPRHTYYAHSTSPSEPLTLSLDIYGAIQT